MEHAERKQPPYMIVFASLGVLTAIEIGVAFFGLPRLYTIVALLALAVWKASLVALYYMHLKFEPRRLWLVVASPFPLAAILVLAVLTEGW
ncbi:MAG TPA: cytochrome C oxidase subunit IV family protein [Longimicrobiales bacterium]